MVSKHQTNLIEKSKNYSNTKKKYRGNQGFYKDINNESFDDVREF